MIIETSSNQLFAVWPTPGIDHAWIGIQVKRVGGGKFDVKRGAREQLVRKAATRVISETLIEKEG